MNFARWPILGSRRPEPARDRAPLVSLQIRSLGDQIRSSGRPWRNETAPKKIFESTRFLGSPAPQGFFSAGRTYPRSVMVFAFRSIVLSMPGRAFAFLFSGALFFLRCIAPVPGALYAALWRRLALSSRAEGLGLLLCPELGLFVPGCGPASCWPCCWLGCMPWILSGLLCGAVSEGRSGRTSWRALISEGMCLVLLIRSGLRRWCALLPAWAPELCLLFRCLPRHRWELR